MIDSTIDTAPVNCTACLPTRRSFTRAEYMLAAEVGILKPDERLELIEGEIYQKMSPQNVLHSATIGALQEALGKIFANGHWVRIQLPLALSERSQPEPDVAVVVGSWRNYRSSQPKTAVLVVEVSDTTLASDRTLKASLYALAGIPEYWIVNLVDRVLEVYRQPAPMAEQPFGHHYRSLTRHTEEEMVSPLAAPAGSIAVADLLPEAAL